MALRLIIGVVWMATIVCHAKILALTQGWMPVWMVSNFLAHPDHHGSLDLLSRQNMGGSWAGKITVNFLAAPDLVRWAWARTMVSEKSSPTTSWNFQTNFEFIFSFTLNQIILQILPKCIGSGSLPQSQKK